MRIIYWGNNAPKLNEPGDMGTTPVLADDQTPFETYTEIHIAPTSTMMEAIKEVNDVMAVHTHDPVPAWLSFNDEGKALADVLNAIYGGAVEMRSLDA